MLARNKILLVFDDENEMAFMEANLKENGFEIASSNIVSEVLTLAIQNPPDLIVLNTLHTEYLLELFNENLKNEQLKNTAVLSLIEPKDYLYVSNEEYFILKPIRPKILLSLIRGLMNHEAVNWLPSTPLMIP
jgi:DNA-binding response OmpR family regulator